MFSKNFAMKTTAVLLLFYLPYIVKAKDWSYDDLKHWPALCHDGEKQSPIDFQADHLIQDCKMPQLDLSRHFSSKDDLQMRNNGHTVQVDIPKNLQSGARLKNGDLPFVYTLRQVHFHWSDRNSEGSEHTVQGLHYPLEAHFVHMKEGLSPSDAVNTPNAIAVLGVFFKIDKKSAIGNKGLAHLTKFIQEVARETDKKIPVSGWKPYSLLPDEDSSFYRYKGSLTTPGCQQVVVWTVFLQPSLVTEQQLRVFRSVTKHGGEILAKNYRPVQALNGRYVFMRVAKCKRSINPADLPDSANKISSYCLFTSFAFFLTWLF